LVDEKALNKLADNAIKIYKKARAEGDPAASFLGAIRQVVGRDNEAYARVHQILTDRSAAKAHIASLRGKKTVRRLPPHQYKLRF
jgi:uncharacterized protein YdbL (DUF1318 family)